MAGIIGYIHQEGQVFPDSLLASMADALEPSQCFYKDLYWDQQVGLGRVSLRIVNPAPQPVWNEARDVYAVMEGELYDNQGLIKDLVQQGYRFESEEDVELILHAYEAYGDEFVKLLNGAFVLAIWDQRKEKLLLANDRIGQYPLYYALVEGGMIFASGVRAVMAYHRLSSQVDRVALAQFLKFNHLLGERTLLSEVKRPRPASLLVWRDNQLHQRAYWKMEHPENYELRSEQDWMEEQLFVLRQAVSRQSRNGERLGLLLSGGLDSRVLLALLKDEVGADNLYTFTWGVPGCVDLSYARELSKKLGIEHKFFELQPEWLKHQAQEAVRLSDGMGNVTAMHALANVEEETRFARIIYKGFMGDGMTGYSLKHQHWANYDEDTRIMAHLQVHHDQGAILFRESELNELFTPEFREEVGDKPFQGYIEGINESSSSLMADQRNVFGLRERVPRMALNGVEAVRSGAFVRLPYCDNDLVDFCLRVPPGLRYERRLIKNAFICAYPDLAQVPYTETGLPMMDCVRETLIRTENLLRWHLNSVGLKNVGLSRQRPYQNYNLWFRTVLRDWVDELLLDELSLRRGYFQPEAVKRLLVEQRAGAKLATQLGVLLSIELWHRMYLD